MARVRVSKKRLVWMRCWPMFRDGIGDIEYSVNITGYPSFEFRMINEFISCTE